MSSINSNIPTVANSDVIQQIKTLVKQELKETKNEYILLNRLGVLLREHNLGSWKNHKANTNATKMYEWAEVCFSDEYCVEERDTGDWCLRPRKADDAMLYPTMESDPGDPQVQAEQKQLQRDLVIPDESTLCSALRKHSGYTGLFSDKWIAYLAHCWALAKFDPNERVFQGTDPSTEKEYLAVRLEQLTAKNGQPLYLLCEKIDGRWTLAQTVCGYPGPFGPGRIFRDILGIRAVGAPDPTYNRFVQFKKLTEELTALYENRSLIDELRRAADCLERGVCYVGENSVLDDLKALSKLWTSALSYHGSYGLELSEETGTLAALQTAVAHAATPDTRLSDLKKELADRLSNLKNCPAMQLRHDLIASDIVLLEAPQADLNPLFSRYALLNTLATCDEATLWSLGPSVLQEFPGEHSTGFVADVREAGPHHDLIRSVTEFIRDTLIPATEASQHSEPQPISEDFEQSRSLPFEFIRDILTKQLDTTQQRPLDQLQLHLGKPNEFEQLLIHGNLAGAKNLAAKEDGLKCYSKEDADKIRARLNQIDRLDSGLTYLYAGNRLYAVQGNLNQRAESYWLATYLENNPFAAEKLLYLYSQEGDRAKEFMTLFECMDTAGKNNPDYLHYILNLYSSLEEHEKVLDVFRMYPEVIYYRTNLETVKLAASECGDDDISAYCAAVNTALFQVMLDSNELEIAICDNDQVALSGWAQSSGFFNDYSPEKIDRIYNLMREDFLPTGTDNYSKAKRFWALVEKDTAADTRLRGHAEYFAWRALDAQRIGEQAADLLFPILASDTNDRSAEIIRFYHSISYHAQLEKSAVCRMYYMKALFRYAQTHGTEEAATIAVEFVRTHLRDVAKDHSYEDAIACCDIAGAAAVKDLLLTLRALADVPFYDSLLCLSEYEASPQDLTALGFEPSEVEHIALMRKQQTPTGQAASNLAAQFHAYIGWHDGWTERLIGHGFRLAEAYNETPHTELLNLRAALDQHQNAWEDLYGLFQAYPQHRENNLPLYAETLFRTENYEEYWPLNDQLFSLLPAPDGSVFHRIAAARAEDWSDGRCVEELSIPASYIVSHADAILSLGEWLWRSGKQETWKTLIPRWAASALSVYTEDQLKSLLSCSGTVPTETLRTCQELWLSSGGVAAALFVWRYLDGSDCSQAAEEFYTQELKSESNLRDSGKGLKTLELLFPDRKDELQLQRAILKLNAATPDLADSESVELVSSQLRREDISPAEQDRLFHLIRTLDPEHIPSTLLTSIALFWGRTAGRDDAGLTVEDYREMRTFLTANCSKPVELTVADTLRKFYAKEGTVALCTLADNYTQNNGELKLSLLELVRQTAPDQLASLFRDAGLFVQPSEEDLNRVQFLETDDSNAAECTEAILRVLCVHPLRHHILQHLPLNDFPEQRLELFKLAADETAKWQACIRCADEVCTDETQRSETLYELFSLWLAGDRLDMSAVFSALDEIPDTVKQNWNMEELFRQICEGFRHVSPAQPRILRHLSQFIFKHHLEALLLRPQEPYEVAREHYYHSEANSELSLLLARLIVNEQVPEAKLCLKYLSDRAIPLNPTPGHHSEFHKALLAPMAAMTEEALSDYIRQPWVKKIFTLLKEDGKLPEYGKLLESWIWPELCSGTAEQLRISAQTLDAIMHALPKYQVLSHLLFFACKKLYDLESVTIPAGSDELIRWLYHAEYKICEEAGLRKNWNLAPHGQSNNVYLAQYEDFLLIAALALHRGLIDSEQVEADVRASLQFLKAHDISRLPSKYQEQYSRNFYEYYRTLITKLQAQANDIEAVQRILLCRVTGSWKEGVRYLYDNNKQISHFKDWAYCDFGNGSCQTAGLFRGLLQVYTGLTTTAKFKRLFDDINEPGQAIFWYLEDAEKNPDLLEFPLEETTINISLQESALHSFDAEDKKYYDKLASRTRLMIGIQYAQLYWAELLIRGAFRGSDPDSLKTAYAYCRAMLSMFQRKKDLNRKEQLTIDAARVRLCASSLLAKIPTDSVHLEPKVNHFSPGEVMGAFLRILSDRDPTCDHHVARFLYNLRQDWRGKPGLNSDLRWRELYALLLHIYEKLSSREIETIILGDTAKDSFLNFVGEDNLTEAHVGKYVTLREQFLTGWSSKKVIPTNLPSYKEIMDQIASLKASASKKTSEEFSYASKTSTDMTIFEGDDSSELRTVLAEGSLVEQLKAACRIYLSNSESLSNRLRVGILRFQHFYGTDHFDQADELLLQMMNDYAHNRKAVQISEEERELYQALEDLISDYMSEMLCRTHINDFADLSKLWGPYAYALETLIVAPHRRTEETEVDSSESEVTALPEEEVIEDGFAFLCDTILNYKAGESDLECIRTKAETYIQNKELLKQVNRLLTNENDKVNARPILKLSLSDHRVFSQDNTYNLFGTVENIGNRSTQQLTLTVEFLTTGVTASVTKFERKHLELWPSGTAPFRISFTAPTGATTVRCSLSVEGVWNHRLIQTYETYDISLERPAKPTAVHFSEVEISAKDFRPAPYLPQAVTHPVLVGRTREMEVIRSWYEKSEFEHWDNGLIYGFRRSGKTTMLHYIKAYLETKYPDTFYIAYSDVSKVSDHSLNFKCVFIDLLLNNTTVVSDIWDSEFVTQWKAVDSDTLTPDQLICFLIGLSTRLGKRLLLQLDEFDRFILANPQEHCQALDAICHDTELKKYVHFVFCGANTMRYPYLTSKEQDSSDEKKFVSQFFDRAVKMLQIGKVDLSDLKAYLRRPQNPPEATMEFSDAVVEHLYEAGGGFLWYTCKMAEHIAENLNKRGQNTVHPFDALDNRTIFKASTTNTANTLKSDFEGTIKQSILTTLADSPIYSLSSAELAQATGIELSTLPSDLETLTDLGYIERTDNGRYRIANAMFRLIFKQEGTEAPTCVFVPQNEHRTPTSQAARRRGLSHLLKQEDANHD